METQSYREILKATLVKRQKVNPDYSLRSFATSIGLDSPQLSRILNKKQGLSTESARRVARRLGFNENEEEHFCLMARASDARSKKDRDLAVMRLEKLLESSSSLSSKDLELKDYEILRDWYNVAILELIDVKGFKNDPSWIARRLGITLQMAKSSLETLEKIGVVSDVGGSLRKTQKILKIGNGTPSDLLKNYYQQLLAKAKDSIYLQSVDKRHLSSVTISLDPADIKILNEEIDKFKSNFNKKAEMLASKKGKEKKEVYCLTTQFFSLNTENTK